VDDRVTVLVGKNESGKTAILEALAKTNYFTDDLTFRFNATLDYPRKEKKKYDKSGEIAIAVTATYQISEQLLAEIGKDVGENIFKMAEFRYETDYENTGKFIELKVDVPAFFKHKLETYGIKDPAAKEKISSVTDIEGLNKVGKEFEDENLVKALDDLKKYFENKWGWSVPLQEYIARKWIKPRMPKFLYYSEYYSLPSRINLIDLKSDTIEDEAAQKTSKALFELADVKLSELIDASDFETYIAELEATANEITQQLFRYWTTNKNLRIKFHIDKQFRNNQPFPILDIRVEDLQHMVSLPLRSRSKGFNWFFSFIVWFSKIQEDRGSRYILLLDEPGLNLHASAQEDLLNFIETLSQDYQIIFTTHSPFMIDSDQLHRVRTVLDTPSGARISESIEEKDPDTLFPLQAALGYDIAQNLFISKNNLLVEGVSDLLFLNVMSSVLQAEGRESLKESITIVPVGGLDKVATFISLLRGSKLNVACLLDAFPDAKGKQRVKDLVREKIIKERNIMYAHEFAQAPAHGDTLEDLFTKEEYLRWFNGSFGEYDNIATSDLDQKIGPIIKQINKAIDKERFNHYRPANHLARIGVTASDFAELTLTSFERLFKRVNKLF
jgi:predicted ATP-dependent endonuclease of OLD family